MQCRKCNNTLTEKHLIQNKADLVFTDPPYNLASDPKNIAAQQLRPGSYGTLANSEWDKNFQIRPALDSLFQFLSENCSVYVCTSHFLAGEIWEWMKTNFETSNYCVWFKPNPMPSLTKRHWTWSSELICYATRGTHVFNFPLEGHAQNVWTFQKNRANDLHPTMKPLSVPEHAIIHSSDPGNIVADLFLGSGSTLIACEKTKRQCFGMEIDPNYCEVILERWQKFTGQQAIREDGVKWDEIPQAFT